MSEPFMGQITLFPYNFAPYGWADCAGQLLPISQYSALFSLLGVAYGGNGTSNFALPDLQGRVTLGQGPAPGGSTYVIGEPGGVENVTILPNTMPMHSHPLNATSVHGTVDTPEGNLLSTPQGTGLPTTAPKGDIYNVAVPDTTLAQTSIRPSGGTLPHNNIQPFLTLRYCIALTGMFPQRS